MDKAINFKTSWRLWPSQLISWKEDRGTSFAWPMGKGMCFSCSKIEHSARWDALNPACAEKSWKFLTSLQMVSNLNLLSKCKCASSITFTENKQPNSFSMLCFTAASLLHVIILFSFPRLAVFSLCLNSLKNSAVPTMVVLEIFPWKFSLRTRIYKLTVVLNTVVPRDPQGTSAMTSKRCQMPQILKSLMSKCIAFVYGLYTYCYFEATLLFKILNIRWMLCI